MNIKPFIRILSNKNYIRLYRLFCYLERYKVSYKIRNIFLNNKFVENENKELNSFKKKLYLIKNLREKILLLLDITKILKNI